MTQAIELNSVRRGYDPREFTLVAAGGAGRLFACDIALELEIPRVLVPPHPGIIAATGLLATDLQHEYVATERHALKTLDRERLERALRRARRRRPSRSSTPTACPRTGGWSRRLADCRYAGQGYEVRFDVPAGAIDDAWVEQLGRGLPRRARGASTASASTPTSRSSTCAWSAIGRVDELRLERARAGRRRPGAGADDRARGRVRGRRRRPALPDARSTSASGCWRATASPGRRSSSSTTRRRSSRPA